MPHATRLLQHYFSYFKSFHDLNTVMSVARCVPNLSITAVHCENALLWDAHLSGKERSTWLVIKTTTNMQMKLTPRTFWPWRQQTRSSPRVVWVAFLLKWWELGRKSLKKSEDEAATDAASDAYSWTLLLMLRPFKRMPKKGGCCYCGCSSPRRASMLRF